jgi:hypothetical protein
MCELIRVNTQFFPFQYGYQDLELNNQDRTHERKHGALCSIYTYKYLLPVLPFAFLMLPRLVPLMYFR